MNIPFLCRTHGLFSKTQYTKGGILQVFTAHYNILYSLHTSEDTVIYTSTCPCTRLVLSHIPHCIVLYCTDWTTHHYTCVPCYTECNFHVDISSSFQISSRTSESISFSSIPSLCNPFVFHIPKGDLDIYIYRKYTSSVP